VDRTAGVKLKPWERAAAFLLIVVIIGVPAHIIVALSAPFRKKRRGS
jgi:hypothetical protein